MVRLRLYLEMQIVNTTTGVNMAVRKSLMGGYTYKDLFDTQEALDTGILGQTSIGTLTTKPKRDKGFLGLGFGAERQGEVDRRATTRDIMVGADALGLELNQEGPIAANRKRRLEQQKMAQAGIGTQQSILGGGAF